MIVFAWILLLAASQSVDLVDEVYKIPANEWRYVDLGLNQRSALVSAHFEVQSGSKRVRLALMRSEDLDRLREGLPHGVIDETDTGTSGALRPLVRGTGNYVVVVDNAGDTVAAVHLNVHLDFGSGGPVVTQLSRQRQITIILISFTVFFGIVSWSARRLLRGIRRDPSRPA